MRLWNLWEMLHSFTCQWSWLEERSQHLPMKSDKYQVCQIIQSFSEKQDSMFSSSWWMSINFWLNSSISHSKASSAKENSEFQLSYIPFSLRLWSIHLMKTRLDHLPTYKKLNPKSLRSREDGQMIKKSLTQRQLVSILKRV